jgi:hypothetical protein
MRKLRGIARSDITHILDREAAHVARGVGGAALAGNRREAHEHRRALAARSRIDAHTVERKVGRIKPRPRPAVADLVLVVRHVFTSAIVQSVKPSADVRKERAPWRESRTSR